MKCTKCGAQFENEQLFCPYCGEEVQLVPDYYSNDAVDYAKQKQKREQQETLKKQQEEQKEEEQRLQKRKNKRKIVAAVVLVMLVAVSLFAVQSYRDVQNHNSYSYQMKRAETLFSNMDYEEACVYAQRAVKLDPASLDAEVLLAQIYLKTGLEEKAVEKLETIIAKQPDYSAAYGPLLRQYEELGESDKIKELLDQCTDEKVRQKFANYICVLPTVDLVPGEYETTQELTITPDNKTDTVYYTTDGTEPTVESSIYREPIVLDEGTTVLKIRAVNKKGIQSDVKSLTYKIQIPAPDAPKITPSSGVYTTDMDNTRIYVIVPDGCKAYYSFDKPATTEDNVYSTPVEMPEGEHTFCAILVNEYGKASVVGSATYILETKENE